MESERVVLTPLDRRYPLRLRALATPPASLIVAGGSLDAEQTVAIVGSRKASKEALAFAGELAAAVAATGAVVVSGGALGVDGAAHGAVLAAGRATWVVAGTDPSGCYPEEHVQLFAAVAKGPGAMVWPFSRPLPQPRLGFPKRNRILVALADVVVVVQAGPRSGALSAARCARAQSKPLWVVPIPPWADEEFAGSRQLLESGARPLTSIRTFLNEIAPPLLLGTRPEGVPFAPHETEVLAAMCDVPRHLDSITAQTHLPTHTTAAALLTLALENVVVEGPPGFFRRRHAR